MEGPAVHEVIQDLGEERRRHRIPSKLRVRLSVRYIKSKTRGAGHLVITDYSDMRLRVKTLGRELVVEAQQSKFAGVDGQLVYGCLDVACLDKRRTLSWLQGNSKRNMNDFFVQINVSITFIDANMSLLAISTVGKLYTLSLLYRSQSFFKLSQTTVTRKRSQAMTTQTSPQNPLLNVRWT